MGLRKRYNKWHYEWFVERNDEKRLRLYGIPWGYHRNLEFHWRKERPDTKTYLDPVLIDVASTRPKHPTARNWKWPGVSVYVPKSLESESKDVVESVKAALSDPEFRTKVGEGAGTTDHILAVVEPELQRNGTEIRVDFQNSEVVCEHPATVKLLRSEMAKEKL